MDVSTIIAIVVLALFTIVYLVSFGLMLSYSARNYPLGNYDEEVKLEIHHEYKKYLKEYDPDEDESFIDYTKRKRKNARYNSIALNIVDWVICIFCVAVVIFSCYLKSQHQQLFIGDSSLMVVETGSMATVNDFNDYIEENNLDDQIPQSSLITITRVKDPSDMKIYDIYAFEVDDNIIIHRLIDINEVDGETVYVFRGDANSGSLSYETAITFTQIVGHYTGYNNQALGTIVIYLQSPVGIIAVFCAVVILLGYDLYHSKTVKAFRKRHDFLMYDAKRIYDEIEDVKNNRIVNQTLLKKVRDKNIQSYKYVQTLVTQGLYPVGSQAIILKTLDDGKKVEVLITDAAQPEVLVYKADDVVLIPAPFKEDR